MWLISGLIFSWWRRWYGGGFSETWLGNHRGVQCIVFLLLNFLVLGHSYLLEHFHYCKLVAIIALDVWLYADFWSRGHGACFDIGRWNPDESLVKRYNERWYHIPLDKILTNHKYGFLYDFLYMGMRYTCPMLPLVFIDIKYLIIGLLISPIYALCWTLNEKEGWIFNKIPYVSMATNLAEFLVGFVYGALLW